MNVIPIGEFRKFVYKTPVPEIKESMPLKLTSDGQLFAILAKPEDIVVIADLHPAVQKQFRAKEQLVRRAGNKPDTRLDYPAELAEIPEVKPAE